MPHFSSRIWEPGAGERNKPALPIMPARPSCGRAQLRHRARCPSRLRSPPPPKRGKRGTQEPRTLRPWPLSPFLGQQGFLGPAPQPSRPLGAQPQARAPHPAPRPDPLPRPRGSSPACPGRIGAGTRAARRTAPTPARAAPRWWLCGKRPRWCASGSRRWCGPGSTSRRGEQGSRPPLSNPALGPPRPARPGSAPAASPGRLRFSARGASANARADEDGRGQPRDRPPGRGGRKPDPPAPRAASASQRGTGHVSAAPSVYL